MLLHSSLDVHRIIEFFGLEGTFEDHLVKLCCRGQEHLSLDQVAVHLRALNRTMVFSELGRQWNRVQVLE